MGAAGRWRTRRAIRGFLRIVVGYDGSSPAGRALDAAVRLLQGRAGCIDVVWVAHLSSTVRLSADAVVEMEAVFDELEPELRAQAAGQLRGRGADWQFERRQGELVACHSPHGRFGRRQPGPPCTGSPRDRAIGPRCSKPRPGPRDPSHADRNTTVRSELFKLFSRTISGITCSPRKPCRGAPSRPLPGRRRTRRGGGRR